MKVKEVTHTSNYQILDLEEITIKIIPVNELNMILDSLKLFEWILTNYYMNADQYLAFCLVYHL
jgi:hypothetical protein